MLHAIKSRVQRRGFLRKAPTCQFSVFSRTIAIPSLRRWVPCVSRIGINFLFGEFDSGSERTLAAWIRHASRTRNLLSLL